ncbi:MAG: glycosyl transferase, group 1 [Chloroflexi bacterium]|nr:glycosyl transferase, group 1 [Chloroflexota bacterium]
MRLLVVVTYYHPHWTGLTAVAQRVAEGMADRGHQVTVLTSHFQRGLARTEMLNGVRVVRLPTLMRVSRGMLMPTFASAAARLVSQNDVVQIHTPMLEASLLTTMARRAGVRTVITHHGDLLMPPTPFDQTVQWIVTALLRRAFAMTDRVIAYTQDYIDSSPFLRPYAKKCVPVAPPVEMCEPNLGTAIGWRDELGLTHRQVVGFAGRFVAEKGFDYLLQAIPLVAREMPDVRFVYAGDQHPVYEDFFARCRPLVDAVEPYLVWLGLLREQQKLADFYAMCDVLAVPSRSDTFNLVQVESMLCGTPVVMSDIPGGRVPVTLTGMGRLVRPRDPVDLATGLLDVLSNRSDYVRPRTDIEAVFGRQRSLDEYERALFGSLQERSFL